MDFVVEEDVESFGDAHVRNYPCVTVRSKPIGVATAFAISTYPTEQEWRKSECEDAKPYNRYI